MVRRTATEDANAGVVRSPSVVPTTSASITVPKHHRNNTLHANGLLGVGIDALGKALEKNAEEADKKDAEKAAIEVGMSMAISDEVAARKRAGWHEAIFGQDATWQGAVNQATKNKSTAAYLEKLGEIENKAHLPPADYAKELDEVSENIRKMYEDPDMQHAALTQWTEKMTTLSAQQAREHFKYTQLENNREAVIGMGVDYDSFIIESQQGMTESVRTEASTKRKEFWTERNTVPNATPQATRNMKTEYLLSTVSSGNYTAYKDAVDAGFVKNMSPQESQAMEQALNKYRNINNQRIASTTIAAITTAEGSNDISYITKAVRDIRGLYKNSTGTDEESIAFHRNLRQLQSAGDAITRASAVADKDELTAQSYFLMTETNDPPQGAVNKKVRDGAADVSLQVYASTPDELEGDEPLSLDEAISRVMNDRNLLDRTVQRIVKTGDMSPTLQKTAKWMVNDFTKYTDENDMLTPEYRSQIQNMLALTRSNPYGMEQLLGKEDLKLLNFMGTRLDLRGSQINSDWQNQHRLEIEGKGSRVTADQLGLPPKVKINEWIAQEWEKVHGTVPPANTIAELHTMLSDTYSAVGTPDGTMESFKSRLLSDTQEYKGIMIPMSSTMEGQLNMDMKVSDALEAWDGTPPMLDLMRSYGVPADVTSISQLKGVSLKWDTGREALEIRTSDVLGLPIYITGDDLRMIASVYRKEQEDLDKKIGDAQAKHWNDTWKSLWREETGQREPMNYD